MHNLKITQSNFFFLIIIICIKYQVVFKINVDITWGDYMESEFSIQSDKVSVIQCTTKDSKFDPTNTVFAFDDASLDKLVKFFNSFNGVNINKEDIMFLHKEGRCPI